MYEVNYVVTPVVMIRGTEKKEGFNLKNVIYGCMIQIFLCYGLNLFLT